MHLLAVFFWFLAAPFWESKAPEQWSNDEVQAMFVRSPWVNVAFPVGNSGSRVPLPVYLASAKPMQDAEAEVERRGKAGTDPLKDEYRQWAKENEGKYMILAVLHPRTLVEADSRDMRRMESECLLRIGRKTHKMVMHFPPLPPMPGCGWSSRGWSGLLTKSSSLNSICR
jgi:hypothetical protein